MRGKRCLVGCLVSELRLAQSQSGVMRLFSGALVKGTRLLKGSADGAPAMHLITWHLLYN